ncbi:MAG TPA: hypothetical protein VJI69_06385 [Bacteroidia bacterium]|nr:hypothetical protein [Bacteroidia bacterium]
MEKNRWKSQLKINEKIDVSKTETIKVKNFDSLKHLVLDQRGYFLIRVNHSTNEIEVGFCEELNKVKYKFVSKNVPNVVQNMYMAILDKNIVDRMDHASYLGEELEKAKVALDLGLEYKQDFSLDFRAKIKK